MGRLNEIMNEVAVVATRRTRFDRDIYWRAITKLGGGGSFIMRDVLAECGLPMDRSNHLISYLQGLVNAGTLTRDGHPPKPCRYTLVKQQQFTPQVRRDGTAYELPSHSHAGKLTVVIPRSEAGAWAVVRELARDRRTFTLDDIHGRMRGALPPEAITDYLARLTRGGFTEAVPGDGWRLVRSQPETPRLARDGTPLAGPQRFANMWRSMKMVTYFTALDLASAASLPELPITVEQAARYASDLAAAGYLLARERPGEPMLYRLKETRNTGPAAPEVLRARFVWDPNLCRVVGETTAIEEVRP